MQIEYKTLSEIRPYEKNPRRNEASVQYVANSIKEFGFKVPIVVDKNGVIIAGHTRYKAAKSLGLEKVPCIIAADLNDAQVKAYRLADNKVGEFSEWDMDLLIGELQDLSDFDMANLGFDDLVIPGTEEEKEVVEDDYDEDLPEEPKSKRGQIYQLGIHTLMVGDSTSTEDVQMLVGGGQVDLVVTDPPYNVDISNTKGMKIENDNMSDESFDEFLDKAFENLSNSLKEGGAFYIWHASRTQRAFENSLNKAGLTVRQQLIWNKNALILGRSDYHWKHEPCFYGWKDGAAHYFIDNRALTTVIEDETPDFKKMKKEDMIKLLEEIFADKVSTTVINEKKPAVNDLHPTMKPLKLIARHITNSSKPGDKVLDLFGGSGSTLMSCEQLGRKCYTMEYDPRYADAIINRWETFTGKKAELIKE